MILSGNESLESVISDVQNHPKVSRLTRKSISLNNLTYEQKSLLIRKRKECKEMTQRELGEWAQNEFGLPTPLQQSTISNILKNEEKIISLGPINHRNVKRRRKLICEPIDTAIAEWVRNEMDMGKIVTDDAIIEKCQLLASDFRIKDPGIELPNFSNGWLTSFRMRHGFQDVNDCVGVEMLLPDGTSTTQYRSGSSGYIIDQSYITGIDTSGGMNSASLPFPEVLSQGPAGSQHLINNYYNSSLAATIESKIRILREARKICLEYAAGGLTMGSNNTTDMAKTLNHEELRVLGTVEEKLQVMLEVLRIPNGMNDKSIN